MNPKTRGFTLVETLIAFLLVSLVFITAASLYLTALRFFRTASSGQTNGTNLDQRIAVSTMEGPISQANLLSFGDSFLLDPTDPTSTAFRQLKARVDNPKFTLFTKAGDDWYLYGLVPVNPDPSILPADRKYALRWKKTTAVDASVPATNVIASDPELVQGLVLDKSAGFIQVNPLGVGRVRIARIQLFKDATSPQNSVVMDVVAEPMTK